MSIHRRAKERHVFQYFVEIFLHHLVHFAIDRVAVAVVQRALGLNDVRLDSELTRDDAERVAIRPAQNTSSEIGPHLLDVFVALAGIFRLRRFLPRLVDELGRKLARVHAPSQTLARFQNHHSVPKIFQVFRRGESGDTGADDDDGHLLRGPFLLREFFKLGRRAHDAVVDVSKHREISVHPVREVDEFVLEHVRRRRRGQILARFRSPFDDERVSDRDEIAVVVGFTRRQERALDVGQAVGFEV